jgi:hypothetical protein
MVNKVNIMVINNTHMLQAMLINLLHIASKVIISKIMFNVHIMQDMGMFSLLRRGVEFDSINVCI